MAADLHIHAITDDRLNMLIDLAGSIHAVDARVYLQYSKNVWIGEVSWLKAGLFEDEETFIPSTVGRIDELINSGAGVETLDDTLIAEILKAMDIENKTNYSLADKKDVEEFLKTYKGYEVFTVSW